MQLTSAVEYTHRSLLEELWLRAHRSPHQEQQLLKYNGKGRITQTDPEYATITIQLPHSTAVKSHELWAHIYCIHMHIYALFI